jgi:hypothetical protein
MTTDTDDNPAPYVPWSVTLEVDHLNGPPFNLDQHANEAEDRLTAELDNMIISLAGGTRIRVGIHAITRNTDTATEVQP